MNYRHDLLSLRTPGMMSWKKIRGSTDHAAVLSSDKTRRSLEESQLVKPGEHEEYGPRSLFIASIFELSQCPRTPDLLGVDRLPRNLINGVLWCAAAACRNALVAFMVDDSCRDARCKVIIRDKCHCIFR